MTYSFDTMLNWLARGVLLATVIAGMAMLAYATTAPAAQPVPANAPPATVAAGSKAAISGAAMAHTCAACHGTLGRLGDESFMPLAGMPLRQFTESMTNFRDAKRPATLMGHVAQGFSDAEILAMGEFFAAITPEEKQP